MAIAAVPGYIPRARFDEASPGLRFGMYLRVWGEDQRTGEPLWTTTDRVESVRGELHEKRLLPEDKKGDALQRSRRLTPRDLDTMRALAARMGALADASCQQVMRVPAKAISPFTTGLGQAHPLENGFSFLSPYGLPYLPGSGIKGVLRRAVGELLATGGTDYADNSVDALFGHDSGAEDGFLRGVLSFWDVVPQIEGGQLLVEIMSPHQSHYVQGTESPHDSGKVNPIAFLTVPPGSEFAFHVACDSRRLRGLAPALADGGWRDLLMAAFKHAFQWLGFGAKTAVGYGAMQLDEGAVRRESEARERRDQEARRAALSEGLRQVADFVEGMRRHHVELRGRFEPPNTEWHARARALARNAEAWTPDERRLAAEAIEEWLPKVVRVDLKEERKKLKLRQLKGEA